ncbi:hypothetical protein CFP56_025952 [Quercus suber]|uniref:Uncharacterized protein n=1 Tax=Quercus suber TaxID=58331 RepID=A0AAW0LW64_QUESU
MLEWRKGQRDLGGEVDAVHFETNDNHKVDRGNGDIVAGGVRKWQILLEYEYKLSSKKRRVVKGAWVCQIQDQEGERAWLVGCRS